MSDAATSDDWAQACAHALDKFEDFTEKCAKNNNNNRAFAVLTARALTNIVGPLLFHLCLCVLLRPHSMDSLAHALPPTPLAFAAYAGGRRAKEHIFVRLHFRK